MTWIDLVRDEAAKAGKPVPTHDEAANILWEYTGYPSFFQGDPVEDCRRKLWEFFAEVAGAEDERR